MSSLQEGEAQRSSNRMLAALVDGRRRRILSMLLDRSSPVDEADLARRLAAERAGSAGDAAPEDADRARVELRHAHLPALSEAGLVVWDEADATVAELWITDVVGKGNREAGDKRRGAHGNPAAP